MNQKISAEHSFLNPEKAVSAAKIREGMTVADFGAGAGFFTLEAARAVGPSGHVWAVDVHRDLLSRLKRLAEHNGLHNVEIVAGDCEAHCGSMLADHSIDMAIVANILFSAKNKEKIAEEVWRVLKGGKKGTHGRTGRVLVVDWKRARRGFGPHPDRVMSYDEARALFERNGFKFKEEVSGGAYHWAFVAEKL
ncbi:MAG TPA: methyltransferase domain-containing protein [Candidatus Paceibacterota bacterium]